MTDDDLLALAEEHCARYVAGDGLYVFDRRLLFFASAVAARARAEAMEEAARVCDARGVQFFSMSPAAAECHGLAAAIRARVDALKNTIPCSCKRVDARVCATVKGQWEPCGCLCHAIRARVAEEKA